MDTPLEESNLAHIGSDEDKAARERAAKLEVNWEGCGEKPGIEIWRVENKRTEGGAPDFGINKWPTSRYGEFYSGDSYIVLETRKDKESDALEWDIYFWIGSESTQDEYGVAAYKTVELDDLLGDAPVQHREVQGMETEEFMNLFDKYHGIRYLDGGIESGFRHVVRVLIEIRQFNQFEKCGLSDHPFLWILFSQEAGEGSRPKMPNRLFHVRKTGRVTRSRQVPVSCESLNQGDAFLLDTGSKVLTWYGSSASPFEKERCAEMAYNIVQSRGGHCVAENDVDDDHALFWYLLGGKTDIKEASEVTDDVMPAAQDPQMWRVHEEESRISLDKVAPEKSNLDPGDVFLLDIGHTVYIWVGKGASPREKSQSMVLVQTHLKNFKREKNTKVARVLQGQEERVTGFAAACA